MDLATLLGILIALAGILIGQAIEGGSIIQILQPTAAMIVFGGTIGATMIGFPLSTFKAAISDLVHLIRNQDFNPNSIIDDIVRFTEQSPARGNHRSGKGCASHQGRLFQKAIMMAVDGSEPKELRQAMECELGYMEERGEHSAKVLEAAGGFAPTIGIIGAVLGLIQVMQHLDNIEEVGKGIAVAFVATIYGVGIANIFLLPAAAKLKFKHRQHIIVKEMMLEGVLGILEGQNPRIIEGKLVSFLDEKYQKLREQTAKTKPKAA